MKTFSKNQSITTETETNDFCLQKATPQIIGITNCPHCSAIEPHGVTKEAKNQVTCFMKQEISIVYDGDVAILIKKY